MRVTVTGASGHVGAALVRALLERGDSVRALVRGDTRAIEGLDVERISGDVTDAASVARAVEGAEYVFHAAARVTLETTRDEAADRTNVGGTQNVLRACQKAGVRRLVHFSTVHALKPDGSGLLGPHEGFAYERSKVVAERAVLRETEVDSVIVSPCAVIGPHDFKPSYMGRVMLMLAKGWLIATVRGGQSWVDVRDIANAAIAAAEKGEKHARYVVGGHWRPIHELASIASRIAGVSPPRLSFPAGLARAFAPAIEKGLRRFQDEPLITRASLEALEQTPRHYGDRAMRELGHAPRPLEQTLEDTFAWLKAQGKLRS